MLTYQAVEVLLDWVLGEATKEEQGRFAVHLEKLMTEYYQPKQIAITGRTMADIINDWGINNPSK